MTTCLLLMSFLSNLSQGVSFLLLTSLSPSILRSFCPFLLLCRPYKFILCSMKILFCQLKSIFIFDYHSKTLKKMTKDFFTSKCKSLFICAMNYRTRHEYLPSSTCVENKKFSSRLKNTFCPRRSFFFLKHT